MLDCLLWSGQGVRCTCDLHFTGPFSRNVVNFLKQLGFSVAKYNPYFVELYFCFLAGSLSV